MAITPRAVGTWAAVNATTQTVTLPTHVAGDMLIVRTVRKPFTSPDNTVINTSGWTAVATGVANGSTANGVGVGSMGFKAFYKVATSSSETNPVVTWGTTADPGAAVAVTYQLGANEAWDLPVGNGGGDATARTSQTSTIASHISVTTGDLVDFFRGQCDDSGALTVPTITQTSVTYNTVTEYPATALSSGTGNDIAADGGYRTATAGTSSAAAVVTGTSAASEQHGAWMTRLRVHSLVSSSFTADAIQRVTFEPWLPYVSKIGTEGSGDDQFSAPSQVATDGTHVYVADTNNNRIVKRLASDLSYVSKIGTSGSGNDQFAVPSGIATDGTYLYVVDGGNHRIVKRLASDLSYVSQIGSSGSGDDQFSGPYHVAADGTYIYIADRSNNRIVKRLASDLSYVSKIGTSGSGNDQFNLPIGIATDGTYVYVGDAANHRVVKRLASDLSYVSKIGTSGSGNDQFTNVRGVAVVGAHLYVVDQDNERIVRRLASDLSYVSQIGSAGTGDDQLNIPYSVANYGSYVYVIDSGNDRLVKRLIAVTLDAVIAEIPPVSGSFTLDAVLLVPGITVGTSQTHTFPGGEGTDVYGDTARVNEETGVITPEQIGAGNAYLVSFSGVTNFSTIAKFTFSTGTDAYAGVGAFPDGDALLLYLATGGALNFNVDDSQTSEYSTSGQTLLSASGSGKAVFLELAQRLTAAGTLAYAARVWLDDQSRPDWQRRWTRSGLGAETAPHTGVVALPGNPDGRSVLVDWISKSEITNASAFPTWVVFGADATFKKTQAGSFTLDAIINATAVLDRQAAVSSTASSFGTGFGTQSDSAWIAQSFTAGATGNLSRVRYAVWKNGGPTDVVGVELWTNVADKPNALIVSLATHAGAGLTTSQTFHLVNPNIPLVSGTKYSIVFRRSGANNASNYYRTLVYLDPLYANGGTNLYDSSIPSWGNQDATFDAYFVADIALRLTADATILRTQAEDFTLDALVVKPIWLDTFTRTVASGLGTPDLGVPYSWNGAGLLSVGSGYAEGVAAFAGPPEFSAGLIQFDAWYEDDPGHAVYIFTERFELHVDTGAGSFLTQIIDNAGTAFYDLEGVADGAWVRSKLWWGDGFKRVKIWVVGDPEPDWAMSQATDSLTGADHSFILSGRLDNLSILMASGPTWTMGGFTADAWIAPHFTADAIQLKTQSGGAAGVGDMSVYAVFTINGDLNPARLHLRVAAGGNEALSYTIGAGLYVGSLDPGVRVAIYRTDDVDVELDIADVAPSATENDEWAIRAEIWGDPTDVHVRAKLWEVGETEPDWQVEANDNYPAIARSDLVELHPIETYVDLEVEALTSDLHLDAWIPPYFTLDAEISGEATSGSFTLDAIIKRTQRFTDPYDELVLGDSPNLYLRMGEPSGSVIDSSGFGNNGTVSGGITRDITGALSFGDDGAIKLDGASYVSIAHDADLNLGDNFTIELWYKPPPGFEGNPYNYIYDKAATGAAQVYIDNPGGGNMRLAFGGSAGSVVIAAADITDPDHWYHCVFRKNGATSSAWVDGVDVTTDGGDKTSTITNSSGTLVIGAKRDLSAGSYISGSLDELSTYVGMLSDAQVIKHHEAGRAAGEGFSLDALIARVILNDPFTRTEAVGLGLSPEGFYRTTPANLLLGTIQTSVDGSQVVRPTSSSPNSTDVVSRVPGIAYGLVQIDYKTGGSEAQHSYFSYEIPAAAGPAGFTIESSLGDDHIRLGANGADSSARVNVQPYALNTWYRAKVLVSGTDERSVKFWRRDVDPEPADWTTGTRTDDWYAPPAIYADTNGDPNGLILDNLLVLAYSSEPWGVWDFFTANAVLKATATGSFLLDAVVAREQAGSLTLDATLLAARSGSFTVDAVVLATGTGAASLDAVINRAQSGTFTLDAVKLATQAGSFSLDAVVNVVQPGSFTLNAVVNRTQAGSFTLDAWLIATRAGSFTLDAVQRDTIAGSFTLDAWIPSTGVSGFTLDAVTLETISGSFAAEAWISGIFTLDAWLAGSFTLDATVLRTIGGTFTADAVVQASVTTSFTLDAVVNRSSSAAFTLDAIVLAPAAGSFTADAVVTRTITGTFLLDAVVTRTASGTFALDAVITRNMAASTFADAVVLRTLAAATTADAVILAGRTGSVLADAVILASRSGSFPADAILLRTGSGSFTLDAFIPGGATAGSFTVDAVIASSASGSFTLDAVIGRTVTASTTLDAVIRFTGTFVLDAVVTRTASVTVPLDAVIGRSASGAFTLDAVQLKTQAQAGSLDAIVRATRTAGFATDAIFLSPQNASSTLDAWIAQLGEGAFTLDARIQGIVFGTFTLDAWLLANRFGLFTLDASISRRIVGGITATFEAGTIAATATAATIGFTASAGTIAATVTAGTIGFYWLNSRRSWFVLDAALAGAFVLEAEIT